MFELVNTSLPNGLLPGTHGFATVAMTRGLADNLRRRLEDLSAYVHKTSAHDATYETLNPVAWSHLILPRGEHVLGRVAAAPFDYTGRTNRLARLVCLTAAEAKAFNAAETLQRENAYFSAPWQGEARWLEPDAALATRLVAPTARATRKAQAWIDAFGEADGSRYAAGFAAMLRDSIRQNGKPLAFVTSQQSDPDGRRALAFIADLIALLPEDLRTSATFSTYPCAIPIGVKCAIRVLRKDDNGYAQAVAGAPVADFAAKTVQSANLLPRDVELEHLAATGNLPAPSALTTPTKAVSQAAELTPTAASTATDGAIDVSIDIPPATESEEAIAVTEKDASHRKPSLKHRPGPSALLPGQRFDPLFGQRRKRSNGPLIAAVAGGIVLILGLAIFVVREAQTESESSKNETVKNVTAEQRSAKSEDGEAQTSSEKVEEKQNPMIEDAGAKAERLARAKAEKEAKSTATEGVRSGKVEQPLYSDIRHVSICTNDTQVKEDPKTGFGPRNEKQLSAVSVWYYNGDAQHGYVLTECRLNAKTGSGGDWYDANPGFFIPDPKKGKLPPSTPFCRIWRFDTKSDTLYWVTGNDNSPEFDVLPPHNDIPINLAKCFTGPDLRVLAQWEKRFGKVSCQAWTAEGTNPADLIMVKDVPSFIPSDFIVQCFPKRKEALDKEYAEVQAKQPHLEDLQDQTNQLAKAISAFEKEAPSLSNNVVKALEEYRKAKDKYDGIKSAMERTQRDMSAARTKKGKLQNELRTLGNSYPPQRRQELKNDIDSCDKEIVKLDKDWQKQQEDIKKVDVEGPKQIYNTAKKDYDAKMKESGRKKSELTKLVAEVDSILEAKRKVESAQDAFPKSVEEAQRQWTIHVKVNLGGAK